MIMASLYHNNRNTKLSKALTPTKKRKNVVDKDFRKKVQVVFVNNLKLLQYENCESIQTGKGGKKVPLDKQMFMRPNPTEFYRIIYFLLLTLRKDYIKQQFKNCWPIRDSKQNRQFRKLALEEIKKLSASDAIPQNLVQPSLFTSPSGYRAEKLVWLLSSYTLEKKIAKEMPSAYRKLHLPQPKDEKSFVNDKEYIAHLNDILKATKAQKAYKAEEFRRKAATVINTQKMWGNYAIELTDKLRSIESNLDMLKQKNDLATMKINCGETPEEMSLAPLSPEFDMNDLVNEDHGKLFERLEIILRKCDQNDILEQVNEMIKGAGHDNNFENLPEYRLQANNLLSSENFNLISTMQDALNQVKALSIEFNGLDSTLLSESDIGNLKGLEAVPLLGGEKFVSYAKDKMSSIIESLGPLDNIKDESINKPSLEKRNVAAENNNNVDQSDDISLDQLSADCITPSKIKVSVDEGGIKMPKLMPTSSGLKKKDKDQHDNNDAHLMKVMNIPESNTNKAEINLKGIQETLAALRKQKKASNSNHEERNDVKFNNNPRTKDVVEEFLTPAMLKKLVVNENILKTARTKLPVGHQLSPKDLIKEAHGNVHAVSKKVASIEQKRLLVKLLTPTKRHAVPPSPLRTELIKLTAALFKHGSIDQETRGELKNKIIQCKSVRDLQVVHKHISTMFDDSTFETPSVTPKKK